MKLLKAYIYNMYIYNMYILIHDVVSCIIVFMMLYRVSLYSF